MHQPLIDLQHISKSFDSTMVLDDLSLTVKENSFVTLPVSYTHLTLPTT